MPEKMCEDYKGLYQIYHGDDFVIEHMPNTHYFYTAGICSPGLTAAPAIAEYLVDEMAKDGLTFKPHEVVSRKPYVCTADMSKKALKELIKQNPAYGKIVCRCEKITEGEILDAINSPLHPTDVDAIKRRVRPTMGRCQGGFCLSKVIKILSDFYNIPPEKVQLNGKNSEILTK